MQCDFLTEFQHSCYKADNPESAAGKMLLRSLFSVLLIINPVFLNENALRKKIVRRKKHFSLEETFNENGNTVLQGMKMNYVSMIK